MKRGNIPMTTKRNKSVIPRISGARKELLSNYATAAGFLYGVISISEFVNVFNHYEDEKTDAREVHIALERLSKADDIEYSFYDDHILGPDFLPDFPKDLENMKIVRSERKGKPLYLPDKDEFLRYIDPGYREPEKPYADLKSYILEHKLTVKEGLDGVDGDLIDLHEMAQSDVKTSEILQSFIDRGYALRDIEAINNFMQKVIDALNNTRLYENNGFTPAELFEKENAQI
jgi:hypothetical protein